MGFKDLSNKVTYTDNGGSFDNQAVDTVEVENSLSVLATAALANANAAQTAKEAAEAAKTAAETAETNAETAETNAETAETNAETAETNAAASATASANSATAGANSATAAATSETNAASSATTATTKANTATTQANNSANSATASAASATNSANSATAAQTAQTNAETAETNAETAETNAETAETNAAASAVTAATQATNSSNSATASATSATAAQTAQTAAETAETNAETAETNAETAETNAAASASTASTHASTATTKASEAATSATNAASSATNAANSATGASNSQIAAASSAASAAAIFDQFDDTYLGTKSSAPTVDNDGNALATGALYYNSSTQGMFIWTGSEWVAASAAGGASLNNFSYTATAGQTTFSGSDENSNTMSYTVDNIIVTLNGVVLEGGGTDYTATNGSSVVLTSGAVVSDEVNIVAFKTFTTADMVSASNGGAYQGNVDFAAGIDVTGNITVTGTVDGVDIATRDAVLTSTTTTANAALPKAGGTITGDILYNDNVKAIFGAGSDLEIFHQSSNGNSIIKESGGGTLSLQTNGSEVSIWDTTNSQHMGRFINGAEVQLQHDGNTKFITTSTGIDVTGTVTSDSLSVSDGTETTSIPATADRVSFTGASLNYIQSAGSLFVQPTGDLVLNGSGAEIMRLKSGKVGIGTSVPSSQLHLSKAGGTSIKLGTSVNTSEIEAREVGSGQSLILSSVNSADHLVIDGAGKVGIGTSSPSNYTGASSNTLVVGTNLGNNGITIVGGTTGYASLAFADSAGAGTTADYSGLIQYYHNTDNMNFFTSGTERMRIDSSGNLLVGTTEANPASGNVEGVRFSASNSQFSATNATPVYINRKTSDGTIIDLRKNGATVGSIGNNSGGLYIGSGDAGITMESTLDAIIPTNTSSGSYTDNALDIGYSTKRFKDLYLSGTVNATNALFSGYIDFQTGGVNKGNIYTDASTMIINTQGTNTTLNTNGGNVGIGTSSPAQRLQVNTASGNAYIRVERASQTTGQVGIQIGGGTSSTDWFTYMPASSNDLAFFGNSAERMRITSSGNVGIGTSSPEKALHVNSGTTNNVAVFESTDADTRIELRDSSSTHGANTISVTANDMYFTTNASEAMRIDSSGNVLVGETNNFIATSTSATGLALTQDGRFTLSRSAGTPMNVGKIGADGELIDFWKTGAHVGSIGTVNADIYIGNGDAGLHFNASGDQVLPINVGTKAYTNGFLDLGANTARFKDAYLSGGVYLGGTGSANKLDDYEEGTWTPVVGAGGMTGTSITYTATYTKIGNTVTLFLKAYSTTGDIVVPNYQLWSGIPFTPTKTGTSTVITEDIDQFARQGYASVGGTSFAVSACGSATGTNSLEISITYETA